MSQCVGSLPRRGIKADKDGEAVKLIRKAGAIPLLVSNTPELCLSLETTNLVTGRTLNPYNPLRTSGGSSGGEVKCRNVVEPWLLVQLKNKWIYIYYLLTHVDNSSAICSKLLYLFSSIITHPL